MYSSVAREASETEELCGRQEPDLQQARRMAATLDELTLTISQAIFKR